jgi:hypothetical protein
MKCRVHAVRRINIKFHTKYLVEQPTLGWFGYFCINNPSPLNLTYLGESQPNPGTGHQTRKIPKI